MTDYRPPPQEREPLTAGRMLVLVPFPMTVRRITRETALERNRLVLALAAERVAPDVATESPLALMVRDDPTR